MELDSLLCPLQPSQSSSNKRSRPLPHSDSETKRLCTQHNDAISESVAFARSTGPFQGHDLWVGPGFTPTSANNEIVTQCGNGTVTRFPNITEQVIRDSTDPALNGIAVGYESFLPGVCSAQMYNADEDITPESAIEGACHWVQAQSSDYTFDSDAFFSLDERVVQHSSQSNDPNISQPGDVWVDWTLPDSRLPVVHKSDPRLKRMPFNQSACTVSTIRSIERVSDVHPV